MKPKKIKATVLFGLNVAYYRKEKGLTRKELANLAHISVSCLSRIEGGANCSYRSVLCISKALGIPLSLLFDFERWE